MNKAALTVLAIYTAVLAGVYVWAWPDGAYAAIIVAMMVIAVSGLASGLLTRSKLMGLTVGFMFFIGSIFLCMRAKAEGEAIAKVNAILQVYPDSMRTTVIPPPRSDILHRWQVKTDKPVSSVISFYTTPANLGNWKVEKKKDAYILLRRGEEQLSIKFTRESWTYAEFRHFRTTR